MERRCLPVSLCVWWVYIALPDIRFHPIPAYEEKDSVIDPQSDVNPRSSSSPALPPTLQPTTSKGLFDSFRQKMRGHPMMPASPGAEKSHGTQAIESTPLLQERHSNSALSSRAGSSQRERPDQDGEITIV